MIVELNYIHNSFCDDTSIESTDVLHIAKCVNLKWFTGTSNIISHLGMSKYSDLSIISVIVVRWKVRMTRKYRREYKTNGSKSKSSRKKA